jgi:hypothetical protein
MTERAVYTALIIIFSLGLSMDAQEKAPFSRGDYYVAQIHLESFFNKENFKDLNYAYIEGSAYTNEDYQKALLIYKGKKFGEFPVKYNAFLDQMETPNEKGGIGALLKTNELSVKLNDEHYQVLNFKDRSGDVEQAYFIEKVIGDDCSLFQRKYKTLKEGEEAKTSFHQGSPTKFIDHSAYYIKFGDNTLQKVKLKKSKVLGVFPNHIDKLKVFAKERKLDVSSENGLKQLVIYYNTLDKTSS